MERRLHEEPPPRPHDEPPPLPVPRSASAPALAPDVPTYTALEILSKLVRGFAWFYIIVAGAAVLIGLVLVVREGFVAVPVPFAVAIGGGMIALMLFGSAELLAAIRDIAMNSWKQVGLLQGVRAHAPGY
jgi:hypothetical protein